MKVHRSRDEMMKGSKHFVRTVFWGQEMLCGYTRLTWKVSAELEGEVSAMQQAHSSMVVLN